MDLEQQKMQAYRNFQGAVGAGALGAAAPKEIGLLQRIEGVESGLEDIRNRMENLVARIHGGPASLPGTNPANRQAGLPAALSRIEAEIRESLNLLTQLNDQF